jgi:hypothetical protein
LFKKIIKDEKQKASFNYNMSTSNNATSAVYSNYYGGGKGITGTKVTSYSGGTVTAITTSDGVDNQSA